jgi:hypothetical protein
MVSKKVRHRVAIAACVIGIVAVGSAMAIQIATTSLRNHVVALLGPTGHADHVAVGFSRITLDGVVIKAPAGWPAEDTLRARRIVLQPDLWQLLSHKVVIKQVDLDDAYLSILRTTDGKVSLLPNFRTAHTGTTLTASGATTKQNTGQTTGASEAANTTSSAAASSASSSPPSTTSTQKYAVDLEGLTFHGGSLDFFDATVAKPPYRVSLTQMASTIGPLHFPLTTEPTKFAINGLLMGPTHNGQVHLSGSIVFQNQQSDIRTQFMNVDVSALQPYLDKRSKQVNVQSGTVALDVHSVVQDHQLQASGNVTLNDLQLGRGDGPVSLLESIPREAAIAALKDRQNHISLDFTLQGDLSDPKFSLNENIATRIAAGLAKSLGISAEGVARGANDTTRNLGGALLNLIGK